ncbi:DNA cytosine methyltransferase [Zhihengliuella flava]|uniref:DNA cytosine methyltransferase n=1 Tax=Zhihengliuella flava TaxID=1285193 RepID=UPI0018CAF3BF
MADLGYDCQWRGLRAADVGAPHGRFRVFVLGVRRGAVLDPGGSRGHEAIEHNGRSSKARDRAGVPDESDRESVRAGSEREAPQDANVSARGERGQSAPGQAPGGRARADAGRRGGASAPDTLCAAVGQRPGESPVEEAGPHAGHGSGDHGGERTDRDRRETPADAHRGDDAGRKQDPERGQVGRAPAERGSRSDRGREALSDAAGDGRDEGRTEPEGQLGGAHAAERSTTTSDTSVHGRERGQERHSGPDAREEIQHRDDADGRTRPAIEWGPYGPAIRRWEAVRGTAPAPTELTAKGKHRLSARFVEWMMGLEPGWVTDVDISRNEQLKALGNGVVPQQASAALTDMIAAHRRAT